MLRPEWWRAVPKRVRTLRPFAIRSRSHPVLQERQDTGCRERDHRTDTTPKEHPLGRLITHGELESGKGDPAHANRGS